MRNSFLVLFVWQLPPVVLQYSPVQYLPATFDFQEKMMMEGSMTSIFPYEKMSEEWYLHGDSVRVRCAPGTRVRNDTACGEGVFEFDVMCWDGQYQQVTKHVAYTLRLRLCLFMRPHLRVCVCASASVSASTFGSASASASASASVSASTCVCHYACVCHDARECACARGRTPVSVGVCESYEYVKEFQTELGLRANHLPNLQWQCE